ncbi:hypothetical protein SASPL_104891 [Salvia splendens]|uniref:cellulase n=1 Tax=Salvia splendens TaxID=180675 RepID=A0A8X8YIC4_SALSN|nr:hypothetical protein SASPL_104891 [Salvia splendens]
MFSWDDKYAGAQLLVAMSTLEKKMRANGGNVYEMKNNGLNPKGMSYMVGFETNYPKRVHHRGASIKKYPRPVSCQGGFAEWFHKNADKPNVVYGAVVGGPNRNDKYNDDRENYQQAEPATANVAPLVGVLASLALHQV